MSEKFNYDEKKPRKVMGDFYNEFVLTREDLEEKELPGTLCPRESEIVKDLFGWKIVVGKHQIECDTETQAKFLQIFLEIGWRSVLMPSDEKYLAEILQYFEAVKERADRLYFEREKTIFSRKLRQEVKFKFYRSVSGTLAEYQEQKQKEKRKPKRSAEPVS